LVIELNSIGPFARAIGSVSSFISEGNFRFNNQGFFFRETDPSQVILVDLFVPRKFFQKFEVEPSFVGINLAELNRILQRSQTNDVLKMDLTDSELVLHFHGELNRSFHLSLIDVAKDEPSIPNPKFDAVVQVSARVLKESLKDAALFGNSVVLKASGNALTVESRGNQGTLQSIASQTSVVSVKATAETVGKFNLTFLQNVVREADSDKKITLELKTDAPMKISYLIGDIPMQFYLAHMIL